VATRLLQRPEWEMLAALCLALPLAAIFMQPGLPQTADAEIHLHRLVSAGINLDAGYLWPRWTPYLHHGYGYPIHNFYAPGLHLAGGALWLLARLDAVIVWKLLHIIAMFLYPLGAYLWARRFAGRRGALVAAAAYTYLPVRFDELWMQNNLSQFMAMALLPILFWRLEVANERPAARHIAWVGAVFAAIILLHHPTGFLVAPFAGGHNLVIAAVERPRMLRRFAATCAGLALGLALAAVFWVPALAEFRLVQISRVQEGQFSVVANLIPWDELTQPVLPVEQALQNIPRVFATGQAALLVVCAGVLAAVRLPGQRTRLLAAAGVLVVCLFFMTPQSAWWWQSFPIAQLVVYPWRLLGIAALAAVPAAALLPSLARPAWRSPLAGAIIALFAASVLPLYYLPLAFYDVPASEQTPAGAYRYEIRTGNMGLTSGNEYLPTDVQVRPQDGSVARHEAIEWRVDLYTPSLPPGVISERLTDCAGGSTCYRLLVPQPFTLQFNQMYYPGWDVRLGDRPLDARPAGPMGLLTVEVPAGEHRLTVRYGGTTVQHISAFISLCAVAVTVALGLHRAPASPPAIPADEAQKLALGVIALVAGFIVADRAVLRAADFMRPAGDLRNPGAQVITNWQLGNLQLIGYDLPQTSVRPGDTLYVTLYWRLTSPTTRTASAALLLTDRFGTQVWGRADTSRIGNLEFVEWSTQRYVRERLALKVSEDAPPYVGQLRLSAFYAGEPVEYLMTPEGATFAALADIRVVGSNERLPAGAALGTEFEGIFRLHTALLYADGGQLCAALAWEALRSPERDYTVLLHVYDADGSFVQAFDAPPLGNLYPTSLWQAGQRLRDDHCFVPPSGAAALEIGWYTSDTIERLAASAAVRLALP
jgi:hypothetical protein